MTDFESSCIRISPAHTFTFWTEIWGEHKETDSVHPLFCRVELKYHSQGRISKTHFGWRGEWTILKYMLTIFLSSCYWRLWRQCEEPDISQCLIRSPGGCAVACCHNDYNILPWLWVWSCVIGMTVDSALGGFCGWILGFGIWEHLSGLK